MTTYFFVQSKNDRELILKIIYLSNIQGVGAPPDYSFSVV